MWIYWKLKKKRVERESEALTLLISKEKQRKQFSSIFLFFSSSCVATQLETLAELFTFYYDFQELMNPSTSNSFATKSSQSRHEETEKKAMMIIQRAFIIVK